MTTIKDYAKANEQLATMRIIDAQTNDSLAIMLPDFEDVGTDNFDRFEDAFLSMEIIEMYEDEEFMNAKCDMTGFYTKFSDILNGTDSMTEDLDLLLSGYASERTYGNILAKLNA